MEIGYPTRSNRTGRPKDDRSKSLEAGDARDRSMPKSLSFSDLSSRHFGVSDGLSRSYFEAARICLDRHHTSPAEFRLQDNDEEETASAIWERADERLERAWANKDDATEFGAYALAIAATELLRGLV